MCGTASANHVGLKNLPRRKQDLVRASSRAWCCYIQWMSRPELQRIAKNLGLPATGPTDRLVRLVAAFRRDPASWSFSDFLLILPHLSVHQDVRGHSLPALILKEGLTKGMVDPAAALEPGSNSWSWARRYLGCDVYVFVAGALKYQSKGNPRLSEGNIPLFHARPRRNESLWQTTQRGSISRAT